MKHSSRFLLSFLFIVVLTSCQSKHERFRAKAAEAAKVVVYFYEDTASRKDYKGLKVTADRQERIKEIAGYASDSVKEDAKCSPIGHMVFYGKDGQSLFDLQFCLTEENAYLLFGNEHRPLKKEGMQFLRKHYKTFQAVSGS